MASVSLRWVARCGTAAVLALGAVSAPLRAATGDPILEFQSSVGTTPETQGWAHEGRSLSSNCPMPVGPGPCWFQGAQDLEPDTWPDNSCLPGVGCHKQTEHYNSPDPTLGMGSPSTYTEWIGFDDGNNESGRRPLIIPDSSVPHSPPWGAPFFTGAPAHPVLRVVTGDGNNTPGTLPGVNDRNSGKVRIYKSFEPGIADSFTLVVKAAAGPRSGSHPFAELRAFGRRFAFGVDGVPGSPNYGKFTLVNVTGDSGIVQGTIFDRVVLVSQPGSTGPHAGEFFVFRVVVHNDGTFRAYLNEDTVNSASGSFPVVSGPPESEVGLTPLPGDETMWFDSVQLLEGEWPAACPDPAVDTNRNGAVDADDFSAFMLCTNGPGIPTLNTVECSCLDTDEDQDVDMVDFAVLQRCLSTAAPLDPACDD